MILLLLWSLGTLVSFGAFTWLKGHADARFDHNVGLTENPPWILGTLTSWAWPFQAAVAILWMVYFVSYRKGRGSGLAINEELDTLRKLGHEFGEATIRTMKMLTSADIDPDNIDANTMRALNTRAIEQAMAEDLAMRREEKGLALVKPKTEPKTAVERCFDDSLYDVLDRHGYKVPEEYSERQPKGALDL